MRCITRARSPDGSVRTGPYIPPFSELSAVHSTAARLYSGVNPFTGKGVEIDYLAGERKVRVSTCYGDTMYDTDKGYVFTVDSGNVVVHEAW